MIKRIGNRTLEFTNQPTVRAYASVAGKKESGGELRKLCFCDIITVYVLLKMTKDGNKKIYRIYVELLMVVHIKNLNY